MPTTVTSLTSLATSITTDSPFDEPFELVGRKALVGFHSKYVPRHPTPSTDWSFGTGFVARPAEIYLTHSIRVLPASGDMSRRICERLRGRKGGKLALYIGSAVEISLHTRGIVLVG